MQDPSRQGNKLVKRRPVGSRSPSRERGPSANLFSDDTPAVPPLNDFGNTTSVSAMGTNKSPTEKDKKSKWRLSNPFHSKDKERHDAVDGNPDSTYGSNETSSRSDLNSSGIPSFSSTERRGSNPNQPISDEQSRPAPRPNPATVQPAPVTNLIPPTPQGSVRENRDNLQLPPTDTTQLQEAGPSDHAVVNQKSQENISRETHEDARTGYMVTTVTTTTTTTTTTTGPGGSTTVQVPNSQATNLAPKDSITRTSGPRPPSPASPLVQPNLQQTLDPPPEPHQNNPSPPIPNRNNTRNRIELDSVSPAIEHPNPLVSPITPTSPSRANFSYPARTPPAGVARQVPVQDYYASEQQGFHQHHHQGQQQQQGYNQQHQQGQPQQQPQGYNQSGRRDSYDVHPALRPGHNAYQDPAPPIPPKQWGPNQTQHPQQSQQPHAVQKQSTLANLKTAAAGLHGAGEALRGTLNNTVDKRFTNPNNAVHAKNQAAIDAGRTEVETGRLTHHQHQHPPLPAPYPPSLHQNPSAKTPYSGPPVSGSTIEGNSGNAGGGRIGSFVKKMKEGPMASDRGGRSDGRLRVVNE